MKKLFAMIAAAVTGVCSGCHPGGSEAGAAPAGGGAKIEHVDVAGAAQLLESGGVVVLDIRTSQEYAAGHIRGARMIDFRSPEFASQLESLDRQQKYLLHCASGRRSTESLPVFQRLGFTQVVHLDGGFNAWKAAGKPVEP